MGKRKKLCVYFNEVPIKGEGKIIGVEKNLIEWEVRDKKFLKALSLEREMFMQEDERWLRLEVIDVEPRRNYLLTTKGMTDTTGKTYRNHLRVAVSPAKKIVVEVEDPITFETREYRAVDLSEGGVGIIVPKEEQFLKVGETYNLTLRIYDQVLKTAVARGKVVRLEDKGKVLKAGIEFTDVVNLREVVKYIIDRQREIAKFLSDVK